MSNGTSNIHCLLYYPTISLPKGVWLRQALLYWDTIGSIVPHGFDHNRNKITSEIKYLQDEGLFRPFRPDGIVRRGWDNIEEFSQEFRTIFKSPMFQKRHRALQHVDNWLDTADASYSIHLDKMFYTLFEELREMGLAIYERDNPEWYRVERNTALLYMALLAKYIAREDSPLTIPGTHSAAYENLIFQPLRADDGVLCITTNIFKALPTPYSHVPLLEIVEFKRKRQSELQRFRETLDQLQQQLRTCQSTREAEEIAINFSRRMDRDLTVLTEVLADSNLATFMGSFKTLIELDSPTLWAAVGVLTGKASKLVDIPIEWAVTGIGILGAIRLGTYLVDRRNQARTTLRNSPLAYLYHARQFRLIR